MDHLRTIELFVAVAENSSFAGAARALKISNPSATRGINLLEERLGVKLFSRTTRSLKLTDAGAAYLDECKRILTELKSAEDMVSGIYQNPKGRIRITSSVLFGEYYITPIITQFLDQYADISVETVFVDRNVSLVDEGIDIAIRLGQLKDSNLIAVKVGKVRRVVCASPDYLKAHGIPQKPEDLKQHNLISARPLTPNSEWHFADNMYVRVNPRLEVNTMAAATKAARQGWGLSQVLSYQIAPYLENNSLKTVLSNFEPESIPIHVVYVEGRQAAMKVRAFVDFAKDYLRAIPYLQ